MAEPTPLTQNDPILDPKAMELSMRLTSSEAIEAYQRILLEKWGGKRGGKYDAERDWLGDPSVEKGMPALKSDRAKLNMAMILENQARFQRSRRLPVENGHVILQDTATTDLALPTRMVMPIVRRTYANIQQLAWTSVQPMAGPSAYVFWLDFLRDGDSTNMLSTEYNYALTAELGVPPKAKLSLTRKLVEAQKQLLGLEWTLEAEEDARAQLGLDVAGELTGAWSNEFTRNLAFRMIRNVYNVATGGSDSFGRPTEPGASLPATAGGSTPGWQGSIPVSTCPNFVTNDSAENRKAAIYNWLVDQDVEFQKRNFKPTNRIVCDFTLAGLLQKLLTLTSATGADANNMASLGSTNFGTYNGRWTIEATVALPNNTGIMFAEEGLGSALDTAHVYAPYVPIQLTPAVYGAYDATTGAYQNKDAWTRNLRERSASFVTKSYGFAAIAGPASGGFGAV